MLPPFRFCSVCYVLHSCTLGAVVAKMPVILCFQRESELELTPFRCPQFPRNSEKVENVFHFRATLDSLDFGQPERFNRA